MLILLLTIWRVQMLEQVISILVSFPNGERWNLRNTGGPAKRYEMWMAISGAMCEFAGLGRNRTLSDVIVCWTYTMTNPARGMDYARLYSSIGNPVQDKSCGAESEWRGPQERPCPDCREDTSSQTESLESHGAQGCNPDKLLRSFGDKCARYLLGEGGRCVADNFFASPLPTIRQYSCTSKVAKRPGTQSFRQLSRRTRTRHECHWFSWSFSRTC